MTKSPQKYDWLLPLGSWDTHMHIFNGDSYPYHANRSYTPDDALLASYGRFNESLSEEKSLGNTVLVQPSPYGTDNSLILDLLRQQRQSHPTDERMRAIVVIDPDKVTNEQLDEWNDLGVRGVRINAEASGHSSAHEALRAAIKSAAIRISKYNNWKCQVFISGTAWDHIAEVVRDLPLEVIADHQGGMKSASALPEHVTDVTLQPGFGSLLSLAKAGKVYIKISGFYRSSRQTGGGYDDMEPLIKALAREVPDQLIWGTDWPHTGSGANRSEATRYLPEPFRVIDNVAILKNIRQWVGPETWEKMMVTTPERLFS